MDDDAPAVTILFLGDANCGKSTFLSRISSASVAGPARGIKLLRDIDQPFVYELKFSNQPYRLECYDTASPENWTLLKPDIIVLCFDISQRLSLINLQRYWSKQLPHISRTQSTDLPLLILGLKRDKRSESDPNGIIYPQEAYRIAQEMRADKYMECSAVTGELLKEAWEDVCRTAVMTGRSGGGLSEGGCMVM